LPGKALKKDTRYQKDKKRKQCRRRAAIEPIIGHLKSGYRRARNYLKGAISDRINLQMAARCLESETMAAGHCLDLFPVAKTANLSDSLMEI
jgi:IS5 family transposase